MSVASHDQQLSAALRERGQRVTSQRLVIHRVLRELGAHATAETVLAAVADRLPGVSLPTVYATLDLLEELGAVRRVAVPGGPALFDPRTDPHHHMVCSVCGRRRVRPSSRRGAAVRGVRPLCGPGPRCYGSPACGASTSVVNRIPARGPARECSPKSGAEQISSVVPSAPPSMQA